MQQIPLDTAFLCTCSGNPYGKANHSPVAASSEPPSKRPATEPLPASECEQCEPEPMEIELIAQRVRKEAHPVADRFQDSPHSAGLWSTYELARRDSRHGQVHDQNRHELWEERNQLQQQVDNLQTEMARISSDCKQTVNAWLFQLNVSSDRSLSQIFSKAPAVGFSCFCFCWYMLLLPILGAQPNGCQLSLIWEK